MIEAPGALPDGYRLITLERASSTNQIALDRIARGDAVDGDIVFTEIQTAGRGRQGRAWESPPGNLFATLIIRHDGKLAEAAELSFVAALATRDAIATHAPDRAVPVECKWPNDVLIDGRKTAGILLEVGKHPTDAAAWIAVGIGVNLRTPPTEARFPATCLADALGAVVQPMTMLLSLVNRFDHWRRRWQAEGFGPVRQHWLATAYALGDEISVQNGQHSSQGVFRGIADDGALILATSTGDLAISAGDVHFPGAENGH